VAGNLPDFVTMGATSGDSLAPSSTEVFIKLSVRLVRLVFVSGRRARLFFKVPTAVLLS